MNTGVKKRKKKEIKFFILKICQGIQRYVLGFLSSMKNP
tara:strand:- start:548 stop:664 length:117 start_codon:yes stop_codon:yes gene_type:complete